MHIFFSFLCMSINLLPNKVCPSFYVRTCIVMDTHLVLLYMYVNTKLNFGGVQTRENNPHCYKSN